MVAYGYQGEFTSNQLIVNEFRQFFLSFLKISDRLKVELQFEMSVLVIRHHSVQS